MHTEWPHKNSYIKSKKKIYPDEHNELDVTPDIEIYSALIAGTQTKSGPTPFHLIVLSLPTAVRLSFTQIKENCLCCCRIKTYVKQFSVGLIVILLFFMNLL